MKKVIVPLFPSLSHLSYHHPVLFFRAIVFVVDSAIFQKEVRDVAEFLYVLLTDAVITRNAPALVVACNKQGIATLRKFLESWWKLFIWFFFSCLNRRIHSFLSHKVIAVHWVCSHIPRQECPNIWAFTAYSEYIQVIHWCLYLVDITMAKSAKLIQQQLEKEL